ncbi:hypothetical protein ACFLQW_02960 [Candidatus Zixiibacteriota bacterium]
MRRLFSVVMLGGIILGLVYPVNAMPVSPKPRDAALDSCAAGNALNKKQYSGAANSGPVDQNGVSFTKPDRRAIDPVSKIGESLEAASGVNQSGAKTF